MEWKLGKIFAEQRIGWQLQLCKEEGLDFGDIDLIIEGKTQTFKT